MAAVNGFHEIWRGVGDNRWAMRAVRIDRLQRHFRQRCLRQSQCLPVTLNQILTFAAIAFGNRALQLNQGAIARKNMRQVEKSHLHDGIDACAKSAFAGDFRRVNPRKNAPFSDSAPPELLAADATRPRQRCTVC
nr:Uncharacterised protein [Salmonella sp. NCTC 7297]